MDEPNHIAPTNGHWHLDKRVSVGHIVTTVGIVATFALWLMAIDGRVNLIEREIVAINIHDEEHAARNTQQFTKLENRLDVQTLRLEKRMDTQYNEIIRRLELLDARLADHQRTTLKKE